MILNDAVSKTDVLETYAELYDVFDDYKGIQNELHKIYDKLNDLPTVQAELDSVWRKHYEDSYNQGFIDGCKLYEKQSEQKKGKWVGIKIGNGDTRYTCSECGASYECDSRESWDFNFCPNCGADMKEEK